MCMVVVMKHSPAAPQSAATATTRQPHTYRAVHHYRVYTLDFSMASDAELLLEQQQQLYAATAAAAAAAATAHLLLQKGLTHDIKTMYVHCLQLYTMTLHAHVPNGNVQCHALSQQYQCTRRVHSLHTVVMSPGPHLATHLTISSHKYVDNTLQSPCNRFMHAWPQRNTCMMCC